MTTYSEGIVEMDIISIGGGTTACIDAGSPAKANPDPTIILIKGGRNNSRILQLSILLLISPIAPDSKAVLVSLRKISVSGTKSKNPECGRKLANFSSDV